MRGRFDWIMEGKAIFNDWEENGNEIGTRQEKDSEACSVGEGKAIQSRSDRIHRYALYVMSQWSAWFNSGRNFGFTKTVVED